MTPSVTLQIPLPYMAYWHPRNGIMGYWGEAMLMPNFWRGRVSWRPCVFYRDFCPHSVSVASLNHNSWWLLKETEQLVGERLLFFCVKSVKRPWKRLTSCTRFLAGVSIFYKQIWNLYDRQIAIFVFCSLWMLVIWWLIVVKVNDKITSVIWLKLYVQVKLLFSRLSQSTREAGKVSNLILVIHELHSVLVFLMNVLMTFSK